MNRFLISFLLLTSCNLFAQGKFAGSLKSLIGKNYQNQKELVALEGFVLKGGSLLSLGFSGSWLQKENAIVVLFESINSNGSHTILDLIEIKNASINQQIAVADCWEGEQESMATVALVQKPEAETLKAVKAWYFNRDKARIEGMDPTSVKCYGIVDFAQGKLAGTFRDLVGRTYMNEKDLTLLQGFTSRGGSVIEESISASWFSKGNMAVVVFETVNSENNSRFILDVLEIRGLGKDQEVAIAICTDGEQADASIIALVQPSNAERFKALKAWRFNLYKLRIENASAAKVTCIGMVGDD